MSLRQSAFGGQAFEFFLLGFRKVDLLPTARETYQAQDAMMNAAFERDLLQPYSPTKRWSFFSSLRYPVMAWLRRQRQLEYMDKRKKNLVGRLRFLVLKFFHKRNSVRLGFSIPLHAFGPGLSIAHYGTIVVNKDARIGENCRIHQGVTIGSEKGQSPKIGDNCHIGANASIIGGIVIGNNVSIGANAVVTKSFPDGAILVGVPAKNIAVLETSN